MAEAMDEYTVTFNITVSAESSAGAARTVADIMSDYAQRGYYDVAKVRTGETVGVDLEDAPER